MPHIHLLRSACAVACISCADVLGLHDLVQGEDGGNSRTAGASSSEGAGDSPTPPISVEVGGESRDEADGARDDDALLARAPAGATPDTGPSSERDDANHDDSDGGGAEGAIHDAGDASGRAVRDASGPEALEAGVAQRAGDAAAASDARAGDAGCRECGAKACTVHSNGVGQSFEDCVPGRTYNATQARAACAAFTLDPATCTIESCTGRRRSWLTDARADQAACSTGGPVCNCWTFAGVDVGLVQSMKANACEPCVTGGTEWN
jgi:hypothetical protein